MRRTSIVGPILLIAIGTLFLLRNFLPDLHLLDLMSTYWPYVLIGWGFLRLIEVLNWTRSGRPVPNHGIRGGEWALIVFICLIGTTVFWGLKRRPWMSNQISIGAWEIMGEPFDYSLEANRKVGPAPRILIENPRGNTRITGGAGEELRVTGTKTIRSMNRNDADRDDKNSPFEVIDQGGVWLIRTNTDRVASGPQIKCDLDIQLPRGARVETKGRYGDFDLESVDGDVEITSDNAGVRVNNAGGQVRVDLRKSDIVRVVNAKGNVEVKGRGQDIELENIAGTVTVNGSYSGDLSFRQIARTLRFESTSTNFRVEQVPGSIRFSLGNLTANQIVGPIQLRSKSKDIDLTDFQGSLDLDIDKGDITLRPMHPELAKIEAKTGSGEIEFAAPAGAKFEMSAKSRRGGVENDYGAPLTESSHDRSGIIAGVVGTGGPRVVLETGRGEIRVRKASELERPPAPPKPAAPGKLPAEAPIAPRPPLERSMQ